MQRRNALLLVLVATLLGGRAEADAPLSSRSSLLRGDPVAALTASQAEMEDTTLAPAAVVVVLEALRRLQKTEESRAFVDGLAGRDARRSVATIQLARAKSAEIAGNHESAAELYRQIAESARAEGNRHAELVATQELATMFQSAGRFQPAASIALHRQSLELAHELGDSLALAWSQHGLAYCLIAESDFAESQRLALAALGYAERFDLHHLVGDIEGTLATLRWFDLDVPGAIDHFGRANLAYERAHDLGRQASVLRRMAAAHSDLGDYARSIPLLQRARRLAESVGDVGQASFCLEHLGTLSRDMGNLELAKLQWAQAYEGGKDVWPDEWKTAPLVNIGSVLVEQRAFDEALDYFSRAEAILEVAGSQLGMPDVLIRIARCLRESGRPEEALPKLAEAHELALRYELVLDQASCQLELGRCLSQLGRIDEGAAQIDAAEQLVQGQAFPELRLELRGEQARVARLRGELDESRRYLDQALETAEGIRRRCREMTAVQQGIFVRSGHLYEEMVDVLFALHLENPGRGLDRQAFQVAQRAKARSLLDLVVESGIELRIRADPGYQDRERSILERMAELEPDSPRARTEIAHLQTELSVLEAELRTADPRYANLQYPEAVTVESLQKRLEEGELFLEYLLGDRASYVWAVSPDSLQFVRIAGRDVLRAQVLEVLPMLRDYNLLGPDPSYYLSPNHQLSQALLGPIKEALAKARTVIIAPHDILHYLPFETLFIDEGDSGAGDSDPPTAPAPVAFAELPFAIRRFDIRYVPSAQLLLHLLDRAPRPPADRSLLVIGDPLLAPEDVSARVFHEIVGASAIPLGHVGDEIRTLERCFDKGEVLTLTGSSASLPKLRAATNDQTYRFVHVAAHGIYNERRPGFSGILLSADPDQGDDGFLSLAEVFSLHLECDQVVLSACSSGLGEAVRGEGLVGLTHALLYAGARSIVGSLWPVSGESTARFMESFYREIRDDPNRHRSRALAQAKRTMIESPRATNGLDWAHPFLWSGFVMTGNGSP